MYATSFTEDRDSLPVHVTVLASAAGPSAQASLFTVRPAEHRCCASFIAGQVRWCQLTSGLFLVAAGVGGVHVRDSRALLLAHCCAAL